MTEQFKAMVAVEQMLEKERWARTRRGWGT
jgi:hypothetical protein